MHVQGPLTLQILRIIQGFSPRSLPVSFLFQKLPASPADIEMQVRTLAEQGVVKIEGDHVSSLSS
jgi:DNA-binding IclR family transcriptional regulator